MIRTVFKVPIVFLALVCGIFGYDYDLDNLGERISYNVRKQLAPLDNLGERINAEVQQSLEPMRNWNYHTANNMPAINKKFHGLDNLGAQIQQSVYQGLEPVRAMAITFKMRDGVGGTTVVTHLPEGKKFIIKNNQVFTCSGTISDKGLCSGTLTPFAINSKKDYCYHRKGVSMVNNQICIGANSVSVINNIVRCEGSPGAPALLTTIEEYNRLCRGVSETVKYRYIADPNDPAHIQIPNENKSVRCTNNQPGICEFSETRSFPSNSGNVFISSGINSVVVS